jgi:hypothetical protein
MQYKIFLNYRRQDSAGHVGRVSDWLNRFFDPWTIFLDVDGLLASQKFDAKIEAALKSTTVFVAIIGPNWVRAFEGRDSGTDFVQREIKYALQIKGVLVIPVLVGGAKMPDKTQVPEPVHGLIDLHAIEIHDNDFQGGIARIVQQIEQLSSLRRKNESKDVKVGCVTCDGKRMHSQSTLVKTTHVEPGSSYYHEGENVTSVDTTIYRQVQIRSCKGCGAAHLHVMSWDQDTTEDDEATHERFEIVAYRQA